MQLVHSCTKQWILPGELLVSPSFLLKGRCMACTHDIQLTNQTTDEITPEKVCNVLLQLCAVLMFVGRTVSVEVKLAMAY